MITKAKIKEVLSGQNTLNTIIILTLIVLKNQGVIDQDQDVNSLADSFIQNWEWLFTFFILPVVKVVKNIVAGKFSWDFIKNSNFIATIISAASVLLVPLIGEDAYALWGVILTQILNTGYQLNIPVKNRVTLT